MSKNYHLIIIGLGICGAGLLRELSIALPSRSKVAIRIVTSNSVLDKYGPFGKDIDQAKLNRNVDLMNLEFQNSGCDFYHWLKRHQPDTKLTDEVPRYLYGNYIVEQISQASIALFEKGIDFSIVRKTVTELKQEGSKVRLHCSDHSVLVCDRAVVSIGPQRRKDPYTLKACNTYFDSVYPLENLMSELEGHSSIGILGSRLAAIEAALAICQQRSDVPVYLCSPSGELPAVRGDASSTKPRIFKSEVFIRESSLKTEDIRRVLNDELGLFNTNYNVIMQEPSLSSMTAFEYSLKSAELGKARWTSVISSLNLAFNDAFLRLCDQEKEKFRNTFNERWMKQRINIPLTTAKALKKRIDTGQVTLMALDSIQSYETGFKLLSKCGSPIEVCAAVNATGHQNDLRDSDSMLLQSLINTGILSLDKDGRGRVHPDSCEAIPIQNQSPIPVHLLGAASEGTYAFTGAVDVLSYQAYITANSIVATLKKLTGVMP